MKKQCEVDEPSSLPQTGIVRVRVDHEDDLSSFRDPLKKIKMKKGQDLQT